MLDKIVKYEYTYCQAEKLWKIFTYPSYVLALLQSYLQSLKICNFFC
jgi:hypothetical protein